MSIFMLGLGAVSLVGTVWYRLDWKSIRRREVVVVLKDGTSMRGVLVAVRWRHVRLEVVRVWNNTNPVSLDGMVHIDRANIAWVQVP